MIYIILVSMIGALGEDEIVEVDTGHVVSLNVKSQFSLKEADELVQIVLKITKKSQEDLSHLMSLIETEGSPTQKARLKLQCKMIVDKWNQKIEKLGGRPSGIWFADFDFGRGYFCWKYPERTISHWHKYSEGFSKRKPITSNQPIPLPETNPR